MIDGSFFLFPFFFMGIFMPLIIGIAAAAFVFWILMIIDCAKRRFSSDSDRIIWILILIFLGLLGAAIYYFVVKKKRKKK